MPLNDPYEHKELNVVIGKDDYLFMYAGGHNLHFYYTGQLQPAQDAIGRFLKNISERARYCSQANLPYFHILYPNKQTSLAGHYPAKGASIIPYFTADMAPEIPIIDLTNPIDALGVGAWLKTDTHLSRLGESMTAAKIVAEVTGCSSYEHDYGELLSKPYTRSRRGDLSLMLEDHGVNRQEQETLYHPHWIQHQYNNTLPGGNNGLIDIYINQNALRNERILLFGDSFGRGSASCLTFYFEHVMFCRTPYMHPEIIDAFMPTIVCTQSIERYLPDTPPDSSRPNFLLFPLLERHATKYEGSTEFFKALNAELSYPRPPFMNFMATLT